MLIKTVGIHDGMYSTVPSTSMRHRKAKAFPQDLFVTFSMYVRLLPVIMFTSDSMLHTIFAVRLADFCG